jgi:hypothetical protein
MRKFIAIFMLFFVLIAFKNAAAAAEGGGDMRNNTQAAISGREIIIFDRDWKFQREDDLPEMSSPGFKDAKWRKLNVPHDWAIEGNIRPKKRIFDVPVLAAVKGKWLFEKGDGMERKETGFDDSKWQKVTLPADWETHSNYKEDNVYGWYRREIEVPSKWKGKDLILDLGCIDDVDETYFNGELIGSTGKFPPIYMSEWNTQR